jgi:hypothetical protein
LYIYCDESGGVGRGVMTLAAVSIEPDTAEAMLLRFRSMTGLKNELKGSRIDLAERALFFKLFKDSGARATVGIAISAVQPGPGEDRGDHDRKVYSALLNDVIGSLIPESGGCLGIVIDDGRYDAKSLGVINDDIGRLVAPLGLASLELSHVLPGLQIADVVANTFFNRALVTERQSRMAAIIAPLLQTRQIRLRILDRAAV